MHEEHTITSAKELEDHILKINEEITVLQVRCASEESSRLDVQDSKFDTGRSPTKGSRQDSKSPIGRGSKNVTP
jgi:hypothetical protein